MDHLYIQISPAELIDRYSITLMKLAYYIDDNNIKAEKDMLEHVYRQMNYEKKDDRLKQFVQLNCQIWDLKNDLRVKKKLYDLFNIKNARTASMLVIAEDARKELKKAVNRECLFDYLNNNYNQ